MIKVRLDAQNVWVSNLTGGACNFESEFHEINCHITDGSSWRNYLGLYINFLLEKCPPVWLMWTERLEVDVLVSAKNSSWFKFFFLSS